VAVAPTRGARGNAAGVLHAKPKKTDKLKTHGRAHQAHPAASMAGRHARVVHSQQRAHPVRGVPVHKKAKRKSQPKARQSAGNPPPDHGKQK